jgi:hypothetical protein
MPPKSSGVAAELFGCTNRSALSHSSTRDIHNQPTTSPKNKQPALQNTTYLTASPSPSPSQIKRTKTRKESDAKLEWSSWKNSCCVAGHPHYILTFRYKIKMSCPTYAGQCIPGSTTYYCCPEGYGLACGAPPVPGDCPIAPNGALDCPPTPHAPQCQKINPEFKKHGHGLRMGMDHHSLAEIRTCTGNPNGSPLIDGAICPCGMVDPGRLGHCS